MAAIRLSEFTMKETAHTARPRIVTWLGYGGLVPFLALPVLTFVDRERGMFWHATLRAYGAVILSFVGALHWGFATVLGNITPSQRNAMFAWSVVPCLMAWGSLLAHSVLGDLLLVSGFLVHYGQEGRLTSIVTLPAWYLPLRLRLSAVAIMCVAAGAFATSG